MGVTDPKPVTDDDGDILGYECPDCGTLVTTETKAHEHCGEETSLPDYGDTVERSWPAGVRDRAHWMPTDGKMPFSKYVEHPALSYYRDRESERPDSDPRRKWSDPSNWRDFETVDQWVRMDPEQDDEASLVGRAFIMQREGEPYARSGEADPYLFADGDNVRDPETGAVIPEFPAAIDRLTGGEPTYQEVSSSDGGAHGLAEGKLPGNTRTKYIKLRDEPVFGHDEPPMLELYEGPKVAVLTGRRVAGTPEEIAPVDPDGLADLCERGSDAHPNVLAAAAKRSGGGDGSVDTDAAPSVTPETASAGLPDEAPDGIPLCYERALRARAGDPEAVEGVRLNAHGVNLIASNLAVHAGYDVETAVSHFEQFAPAAGSFDRSITKKSLSGTRTKAEKDDLHPPTLGTLRDVGLFAETEACSPDCPIHGDGHEHFDSGVATGEQCGPETCAPPAYDPEPFDREQRWRELEGDRYDAWLDRERAHIWGDGAGAGKTTNGSRGAATRDRPHFIGFDKHAKAREFITNDVTPSRYFHLKGGEQPRHDCCMDATVDADEDEKPECPAHGHPASWPRMNPIYERDRDDPLRERFEVLVSVVGPRRALFLLDEDGELTDENPWLEQFDRLATAERVVGVHEYQTLKTVLEGDSVGERDLILDETPRLLASERRVSVEDLVRVENRLNDLAEAGGISADDSLAQDYQELAAFAGRVRDAIVDAAAGDLSAIDPPRFEGGEYFEVKDPVSGQGVKQNNVAEAAAQIKLAYNEAGVRRVQDGEHNGEPFCIDQLLAAAAKAGLPDEDVRQAIAVPSMLENCPWCTAALGFDNGARCCTECGWHEHDNSVTTKDGELARASAWVDDDPDELDHDEEPALAFKSLPSPTDLPDPLVLDATATPEKVAGLYGQPRDAVDVEGDEPLDLDGQLRVTQVVGGRFGTGDQFHIGGQYHASTIKDSERLRERIQETIDTAGNLHDRPLFGIRKSLIGLFDFPSNGEVLHYGGARGLDFEECDAVVCIGAPHPNVDDLRRDAELLAMDRDDLQVGGEEYSTRRNAPNPPVYRKLLYEDENGDGLAVPTKAYSGLVGTLFREGRENAIEQFVHRIRPVLADELKHAYLLTDVPTDLPVDDVVGLEELADPIEAMLPVSEGAVRLLGHVLDAQNGEGPDGFRAGELVEERTDGTIANKVAGFDRLARLSGEDVTTRTVRNWVEDLEGLGLLTPEEYKQRQGVSYAADPSTSKRALQVLSSSGGFEVATKRRLASLATDLDSGLAWLRRALDLVSISGDRCAWSPPGNGGGSTLHSD
jgi:hypothetical protein